jgi:hypothetical protein
VHKPAQIARRETELIGHRPVVERFLGSLGYLHGLQQRAKGIDVHRSIASMRTPVRNLRGPRSALDCTG